jgi:hypothetical protein
VIALIAITALGALSGEAHAECPPDDPSAQCQYVEDIPQSGGSQPSGGSGSGAGGSSVVPSSPGLSPAVTAKIEREGGRDARRLKAIAASPAYGAPLDTGDQIGASGQAAASRALSESGSAFSAAASAVGGGEGPLVGLFAGLIAVSLAALAFFVRRNRRSWS